MIKYKTPEVEVIEICIEKGYESTNNGTESGGIISPDPMEPA